MCTRVTHVSSRGLVLLFVVVVYSSGGGRGVDVRKLGVPKGREPLSLEEMWQMAKVELYTPGDEVVFLR